MSQAPVPWQVTARNLPEHAANTIHTDEGARAAGFSAALVAGVTTYVYLTHPVIAAWGLDWVQRGGCEVRFRSPVVHGDVVTCTPTFAADGTGAVTVEARTPRIDTTLAALTAQLEPEPLELRDGEALTPVQILLTGELGAGYARRTGDDLDVLEREAFIHPALWPAVANRVFSAQLVRGPWIHTRSTIRHHGIARDGQLATVRGTVVDRYERSGRRAVAHLTIDADGDVVATLEHEAIVELT